jgi:1,4-dihydroxy-6-naphthoate synthase
MFYALANGKIDTGVYEFRHELVDIETLNRRAFTGDLELTAISLHAYAYVHERYVLCPCGASVGDRYGPLLVARDPIELQDVRRATIAVPGTLTTAYLTLRMCLDADFACQVVPFDKIISAVREGNWQGRAVDAGLIIHEGQLTYAAADLYCIVDLGRWWHELTGLPLPLGANAIRRDVARQTMDDITRLLRASIEYGLAHRDEALDYALQFGRDLDRPNADRFVGMYVNDWTVDLGAVGRAAVAELLRRGHEGGVIPRVTSGEWQVASEVTSGK